MTEIETIKIKALHERLVAAQHTLIIQASNSATLPSDNAMRKLADIEVAIGAVEAMLDDHS